MKIFSTASFTNSSKPGPQFFVRRGTGEERLSQSAQVEPGAADQQDAMATCFDLFDLFQSRARPIPRGEIHQRRNKVDQMMGNAATLVHRNFSRGNLNSLVNLYRIAVNDLAAKAQCQVDSQRALAGSGWADDGNNWSAVVVRSTGILPAFFLTSIVARDWLAHPREMIRRIAITS